MKKIWALIVMIVVLTGTVTWQAGATEITPVTQVEIAPVTQQETVMIEQNQGVVHWADKGTIIDLRLGYSTVDFSELKSALDDATSLEANAFLQYLSLTGSFGNANITYGAVTGGVEGMASMFFKVSKYISLGFKGIYLSPGKITNQISGQGYYHETLSYDLNLTASLFSVLGGITFSSPRTPKKESWSLSLLAGPAFAGATLALDELLTDPYLHGYFPYHYSIPFTGSGFFGEISAATEYPLGAGFGITLGVGYHYCSIGEMMAAENADPNHDGNYEVHSGDILKDIHDKNIAFNFSGFDVNGGIKIYF
jgi:hypothetical protein